MTTTSLDRTPGAGDAGRVTGERQERPDSEVPERARRRTFTAQYKQRVLAARRREVAEELGLDRPPGPLLAVDWVPSRPERPEGLIVVYDGGVLSDAEVKEIVLADGELAGFAFVAGDEVAGLVTPLLARRVASCLDAVAAGAVAALENGSPAA
jgi:8-oxo-dGTP pyrophosphatase MutT (NUDIX family)